MMFAADHADVSYHEYATDFRVMAEAQLRVAEAYRIDHVSGISDPAREAADCGAAVEYFPDQPPAIDETAALLADKRDLAALKAPDPLGGGRMHDRVKAVALMKERTGGDKLVEGWIEGPCAEGADLRGINALMLDFYDDPGFVRDLFAFVVEMELGFARAQIEAGADIIGLGDAAASLIGPQFYQEFVWPGEKQLVDAIHELGAGVRLHICGNTTRILAGMGRLGCDIIDIDFLADIGLARREMGPEPALLGNIDPVRALRDGTPESITADLAACRAAAGPRYIVGAGCEVTRDTPPANLMALADYASAADPN